MGTVFFRVINCSFHAKLGAVARETGSLSLGDGNPWKRQALIPIDQPMGWGSAPITASIRVDRRESYWMICAKSCDAHRSRAAAAAALRASRRIVLLPRVLLFPFSSNRPIIGLNSGGRESKLEAHKHRGARLGFPYGRRRLCSCLFLLACHLSLVTCHFAT